MYICDSFSLNFSKNDTLQTKVVEKIKTHFMLNKTFPGNLAVYEVMWKNFVESDKPQMTI